MSEKYPAVCSGNYLAERLSHQAASFVTEAHTDDTVTITHFTDFQSRTNSTWYNDTWQYTSVSCN